MWTSLVEDWWDFRGFHRRSFADIAETVEHARHRCEDESIVDCPSHGLLGGFCGKKRSSRDACRWADFARELRAMREDNDLRGVAERRREQSLYSYPAPECMCREGQPGYQDVPDEEEEEEPGWIKNRGRTLGLGGGSERETEGEIGQVEADGWEERGASERVDVGVGRAAEQSTRSKKQEEAEVWGALRGEWAEGDGTTVSRGRAREGDEEEETEESEEGENENPDTERLKRGRKADKTAGSDGADSWGLMDDRPRVGRRLPINEQH